MARSWFDFNNPPRSGKAKKLWDWFIKEFAVKETDSFSLHINRPGHGWRSQGTPTYCIIWHGTDYVTDFPEEIVKLPSLGNTYYDDYNICYLDTKLWKNKNKS